ncbi:Hypp370 [Branchiostoma lanceolatum]|uniref:Hypp370 protein n=1 Tax=Branchiostoma lanceolatum TaxID=7740 RepID=A0A8J9YKJ9_BRALA|nr:Hypp370 [Branchiostoma lanceolatum]
MIPGLPPTRARQKRSFKDEIMKRSVSDSGARLEPGTDRPSNSPPPSPSRTQLPEMLLQRAGCLEDPPVDKGGKLRSGNSRSVSVTGSSHRLSPVSPFSRDCQARSCPNSPLLRVRSVDSTLLPPTDIKGMVSFERELSDQMARTRLEEPQEYDPEKGGQGNKSPVRIVLPKVQ